MNEWRLKNLFTDNLFDFAKLPRGPHMIVLVRVEN